MKLDLHKNRLLKTFRDSTRAEAPGSVVLNKFTFFMGPKVPCLQESSGAPKRTGCRQQSPSIPLSLGRGDGSKVLGLSPVGAAGKFSSPGSAFCADSYFGIRFTTLFLQ